MKVVIADDHPMVRDALTRTVRAITPDVDIFEAKDYAEIERCLEGLPDLLLLDLNMPGMYGIAGVRRLRAAHPGLSMVVASGEDDPATIRSVLALGVAGFLPKAEQPEVLMHALSLVLSGGTYTPPQALRDLYDGRPAQQPDASGLTPRQMDVLRLLMKGQPNKVIARELGLTEGTVKIHIAAILRALLSRNRTEAVVTARRMGFEG